ncbi:hypothetical protein ASE15_13390 [Oerskovia sp. Root22]|nr:hypothetical protein ASE15_13390 [Oerskovia sp. Root22]
MTLWWDAIPFVLVAIGVLFVPGAAILAIAGPIGWRTAALAPGVSVGVIAIASIAVAFVGLPWSVGAVAGVTALLAVVVAVVRAIFDRRPRRYVERSGGFWLAVAATLVGSALLARRLMFVFGTPESISQTFDNVFHLNALRLIQETGDASPFNLGTISEIGFYPAAWHSVVSLIVDSGASIPVAVNVTNLVIGSLVWTAGCVALARVSFPGSSTAPVLAGVLAASFGAFPFLLLSFGVLYPNFLAYALLPGALTLVVRLAGVAKPEDLDARSWGWWRDVALLALTAGGIGLAHPNGAMALLALTLPIVIARYVGVANRAVALKNGWRPLLVPTAVVVIGVAASYVAWKVIRPPASAATWMPIESQAQAFGEGLFVAPIGTPLTLLTAVLLAVGVLTMLFSRSRRWILGPFAVAILLFVIVAGGPAGELRNFLTGVWYNDPFRLAGLLVIPGVLVATGGGVELVERATARFANRSWITRPVVVGIAVVSCLALVVASQGASVRRGAASAQLAYVESDSAPLLSVDERALIERLPESTPEDATIAVNPWTGAALAYALGDRAVTEKHILTQIDPDVQELHTTLKEIDEDPTVCPAVRRSGVDFVLDFGAHEVNNGNGIPHDYSGLAGLEENDHLRLVDQEGSARLFEVVGCA